MIFQEHSQVVLKSPLPALSLEPGDVGIVVHIHGNGVAYEVEFMTLNGNTIGVETVPARELRVASGSSVPHGACPNFCVNGTDFS